MSVTDLLDIEDCTGFFKSINCTSAEPEVSVIVTCYNHSNFIEDCLTSIFTQETDFLFEVLIGDDASDDDSLEKIETVAGNFQIPTKIFSWKSDKKWLRKGRPTGRFNFIRLYSMAKGRYFARCDGDDAWVTNKKLQIQYECLRNSDYRMVYGQSLFGETIETGVLKSTRNGVFSQESIQWNNLSGNTSSTVFWIDSNKERTLDLLTKEFLLCPWLDWLLQHIILGNGGNGFILPETLGFYRQHSSGIYSSLPEKSILLDTYTQLMFHEYFFQNSGNYSENILEALDSSFRNSVTAAICGNPKEYLWPLGRRNRFKLIMILLCSLWKGEDRV